MLVVVCATGILHLVQILLKMNVENWTLVLVSNEMNARLAEDILKQHQIESHIATHEDSAFPSLGECRLFTLPENAQRALEILKENGLKD